ncbi:MAG: leucine-rich repeat domain-containing protein [Candidatus Sumerlaeales bacterium]|nr:leucine-rich repeat domain-containing protein [Candidatus Sumerlaeales bacterium]
MKYKRAILYTLIGALFFCFPLMVNGEDGQARPPTKIVPFEEIIGYLDANPDLTTVDFFDVKFTRDNIDYLYIHYPQIEFGLTIRLVSDHYVRTDATAYASRHNNKDKFHTSRDFEQLRYCQHLKALDLGHNDIVDISFVGELRELRILILAANDIEDISPLSALKNLEYLELFKNSIGDISPLVGLPNLRDLNICFNRIGDFSPLFNMRKLDRLWLYNANNYSANDPLSKELIAELRANLPNTQIDHTSYSTLGGWREHPKYDVVYQIFRRAGSYLPWDEEVPKAGK